jgi:16S rRNA (cytosine967-C5)-methyltransferase
MPRRLAAEILKRVDQQRRTLDHWLHWADARHPELQPMDRAFIRSIVFGTLRWQGRLDWIISHFTVRNTKAINPLVCIILRMGLFQLLYMDRVPTSAAVNTSVELAKQLKRGWASGFINKVLRRATMESESLPWPDMDNDPVQDLVVNQSFPQWMISRWIRQWGIQPTRDLCRAFNSIAPTTLRTNTLKIQRAELIKALNTDAATARPTPYAPEGIVISNPKGGLLRQPAFDQGWFQIQDEAAQLVSHLLNPQPGQTVWDACAGMGTKTGHMAQLMKNQGRLIAGDIHEHKLEGLSAEMQRLDITIVQRCKLDLHDNGSLQGLPAFDRILLDAPCSGMGVIRKNPDSKWSLTPEALIGHHRRQVDFLDAVCGNLKPGGILVYSVCSMEPEETDRVVEEFLLSHPEFGIYGESVGAMRIFKALMTEEHRLRTTPQDHDMDGFFAAALIKENGTPK